MNGDYIEAENLKLESFGVHILNTVGKVYTCKAKDRSLYTQAWGLSYLNTSPKETLNSARETAKAVWNILEAQNGAKQARMDNLTEEEREFACSSGLPS